MKQCPTCKTTYTDDSLRFCLADGGILIEVIDDTATRERAAILVDIGTAAPARSSVTQPPPRPSSGKKIFTLVAVLAGSAMLVLAGVGIAGFAYYYSDQKAATPTPQPTATIDPEKARLEKELAELQKQLSEAAPTPNPTLFPTSEEVDDINEGDGYVRGRVNSPGDGFLALRTAPDTEKGARITQIPHGSIVMIEDCEQRTKTIAGRVGRWCMVTFQGDTGWVFDAWLDSVKQ